MTLDRLNYEFGSAVREFYARYGDPKGRSSRAAFWYPFAYQIIIYGVLLTLIYLSDGGREFFDTLGEAAMGNVDALEGFDGSLGFSGLTAAVLLILFAVANFVPNLMVRIRRFHDMGYTGWFVLGFLVVGQIPVMGTMAGLINLAWFTRPGTLGPNEYGPDPL